MLCVCVILTKEALHTTEITGQVTIQLLVTRPAPSSLWNIGDGNHFDRIPFSL